LSRPGKRIVAVTPPAGAETGPTLGEVKALLLQYSVTRAGAAYGINEPNLREAYDMICALARKYGVDPEQALRQYRAKAGTRPKLVRRAAADSARESTG
jgi:hypothetical protein